MRMNYDEKIQNLLIRENLHLASFCKRGIAWLIDTCLLCCVFIVVHIGILAQISRVMDYGILRGLLLDCLWQMWLLKVIYDTFFVWLYGSSVGKIICKIGVVSVGLVDKPNFIESFIRAMLKSIGEGLMGITYMFGLGHRFSQTLHDRYTKTLVIAY